MSNAAKNTELVESSQAPNEATAIMAVIEKAALNPEVDIEKMERLMAMQERILDRNAEAEFADAMTRVQSKLPTVLKDATNDQTRSSYSTHETIAKAIKPIYTKEGFTMSFSEEDSQKENYIRVVCILRHRAGHKERHHLDLPLDNTGLKGTTNKTGTHATGSTYTYARRYLTCMVFDVATGDDSDGNSAIEYISKEQADEIRGLMEEAEVDKQRFLEYMGGITSVGYIRINDYAKAIAGISAKKKQQ